MSDSNATDFINPSTFILLGISGLEEAYVWIAIPFCIVYIITIVGNFTILFIVKTEPSLHEPMYYFFCMLAFTDLIGLAVVLRSGIESLAYPFLTRRWPYCSSVSINAPYCMHITVVKLACADTSISSYYGLFGLFCVMGLDVVFIAISYMQILRAIFRLPTKKARLKTFWTCGSHLCVIIIFYMPSVFSALMSRFGQNFPQHVLVLIGSMSLLLPPMLNPIIYGVKTKQIRGRLLGLITQK
ncbi:olfactory receptor 52L1-like [Pelodiscus sinensis]|uniref:olfactory receptor 52L1-like n=1 Tax=Pelodiscus sinensis TaxID=13735 RepID=UPI003F6C00D4